MNWKSIIIGVFIILTGLIVHYLNIAEDKKKYFFEYLITIIVVLVGTLFLILGVLDI